MKNLTSIAKKTFSRAVMALLLVPAFSAVNAYAENSEHNGTIQFTGSIVYASCLNEVNNNNVTLNCLNDNDDMVTNSIDLKKLVKTQGWKVLNGGRSVYSYDWLNEDKQMGMLTIKYS
ncbi:MULTISPECIES: hypothetical protein [Providencia]|uniref:hypothetical protein n=1 Tax=Providencia TaxID=586 RepID=UPI0003E2C3F5|nr:MULTISPECIES: hypothetical protein [Providencia]ETT01339.1 hypothetical protein HMPREF1568_3436 [Providencia alcalifaciens PAL-3]EUC98997.1 hypothetical protein HMPREF1566_0738 [Providencia alcalifaciens PAL-1]MTB44794.1 hypothetical protein [Providencia sp. wls1950]MTC22232.1 hypothetical protein [Providencia sp. wls1938]MTC41927.1 hypothetical protein [Providencia sp. wls1921]